MTHSGKASHDVDTSRKKSVFLMRHGLTEWNERGLVMGQTDIPLCPRGLRQVENALDPLHTLGVEALYSSPMQRCMQTADVLAGKLGLPITVDRGLQERNWGVFEGRAKSERDPTKNPPGGETYEQFCGRVTQALGAIKGTNQRTLVVTHSGVIRLTLEGAKRHEPIPHVSAIELAR